MGNGQCLGGNYFLPIKEPAGAGSPCHYQATRDSTPENVPRGTFSWTMAWQAVGGCVEKAYFLTGHSLGERPGQGTVLKVRSSLGGATALRVPNHHLGVKLQPFGRGDPLRSRTWHRWRRPTKPAGGLQACGSGGLFPRSRDISAVGLEAPGAVRPAHRRSRLPARR